MLSTANTPWMSDEHRLFADSVRRFLDLEMKPNLQRWREAGFVDTSFWRAAGDAGILGATISEDYGGVGGALSFDAVTLYEQAACGDLGWGFVIHSIVSHYVSVYGTDEQKEKWLPGLVAGDLIPAIAMTEPGAGSDLKAIKTKADKEGGGYRVNGSKTFISNGQSANLIIVVARTKPERSPKSISLIVVETDGLAGFERGRNLDKLGMKGQDTSELFFKDVLAPESNLLGGVEGSGFYQLMNQLPWERLMLAIQAVGYMDFILQDALTYTKERKAFGQRVFDFQNSRFKLAEAKTKIEVTRSFVNDCIIKADEGRLNAADASMAKWWATQMQNEVADECLQLFGGYGYMNEYPISQAFVDARVQKIYGGSNEIMKELIARSLDE